MNVAELIDHLTKIDPNVEVMIDVDDFSSINARKIEHIYLVKNELEPLKSILIIDGDWGKVKPTNCTVLMELK